MKRTLVVMLLLLAAVTANATASQPKDDDTTPQLIESFVKVQHDPSWYATQERLWRIEADRTPANDEAWINLWHATRYRQNFADEAEKRDEAENRAELLALADEVHAKAPDSYADYIIDYWCKAVYGLRTGDVHMLEAIAQRPDRIDSYPDYVAYLLRTGNEPLLTDILTRWYESGTFSPTLLNYFYNVLVGLDDNAVLFVNGDVPTYACLMLQYAKGLFKDKKMVCAGLLFSASYRNQVCHELGIAEIAEPAGYSQQETKDWMDSTYLRIINETGRPSYFSAVMDLPSYTDKLYCEGLVYRYSERRYDNLSVKRLNYEERYLTDYLFESFSPETYSASAGKLNLNYIPCFKSLLDDYKATGDRRHYKALHKLMKRIVYRAANLTEDERQQYYAEIER